MKKIFLTGGSGFIGRNILEQLGDKYEFFAPSHSELDLLDKNSVEKYFENNQFDLVIHTANRGGSRKETHLTDVASSNLRIFLNLLGCKNKFNRMIFLGSGAEYDKSRNIQNISEDKFGEYVPKDDYGFYKYVCSRLIENVEDIVSLRIFGIFGKYEDYDVRFISNSICKTLVGLPITINQNVFFDYVYIDDFIKIVEYFINNKAKEKFYNIGTGEKIDLLSLANIIKKISGKDLPISVLKDGLNNEYTCDSSLLRDEIKDINFTPIEKAVEELFKWYKTQPLEKSNFDVNIQ